MTLSREQMVSAIIATRLANLDIYDLTRYYRETEEYEFTHATLDEITDIYYSEVEDL